MMAMAWVKKRFFFSKASFSVSGLEFGRTIAYYSFLGFLVVFIKKNLAENMRYSAVVSISKECLAAFIASSAVYSRQWCYQRPFSMIFYTHVMFVTGIVMLLLEILYGDAVFYTAIILLSFDKLGKKYMDEFHESQEDEESNAEKHDACSNIAKISAVIISLGILSFYLDLDSEIILVISAAVIATGLAFLWLCSKLACLELDLNQDHDGDEEQDGDREKFPLLKVLLCWTPFLIYYMVEAAGSAFFFEQWKTDQGKTLWDIGESELYLMQQFSGIIVPYMISKMINMFWRKNYSDHDQQQQERCAMLTNIAFGMFICTCCCMDAFYTEAQRLRSAKTRDDDPDIDIPLNVMFILQFILFGTMRNLVGEMMEEYFLYHVPRPRHHLEYVFTSFMEGIGKLLVVVCILVFKKLIGDSANESRLDILYLVLAILSFCGLIAFVSLSYHSEKRKMVKAASVSRQDSSSSPSEETTIEMMTQSKSDNADNYLAVVSAGADESLPNSDDNLAVVVASAAGGAAADDDNDDDDDESLQNSDDNLAVVVASVASAAGADDDDQLLITKSSETELPQSSVEPSPVDHTESETVALLPSPHNPTRSRRWPILKNFLKSISALRYRHQA